LGAIISSATPRDDSKTGPRATTKVFLSITNAPRAQSRNDVGLDAPRARSSRGGRKSQGIGPFMEDDR